MSPFWSGEPNNLFSNCLFQCMIYTLLSNAKLSTRRLPYFLQLHFVHSSQPGELRKYFIEPLLTIWKIIQFTACILELLLRHGLGQYMCFIMDRAILVFFLNIHISSLFLLLSYFKWKHPLTLAIFVMILYLPGAQHYFEELSYWQTLSFYGILKEEIRD